MTSLKKLKNVTTKTTNQLLIGGHLSVAGGFPIALQRTVQIGGNTLQIFSSSPRSWAPRIVSETEIKEFVRLKQELGIDPIYFHASYLINLADGGDLGQKSVGSLIFELNLAAKLGIKGSIIHLGSFNRDGTSYATLIANCREVLDQTPGNTLFIIENAGSRKIGLTLEEIGRIIKDLSSDRVRVCLDTCHMHAAGFDVSTHVKFDVFFKEFDQKIGLEKLEVFQVNDSKFALRAYRDRHENIGMGTIPPETFHLLLTDPRTKSKPFILETPGFDHNGPDKENVQRLQVLAKQVNLGTIKLST